jgi:REP element-mobilizing transposase RayT
VIESLHHIRMVNDKPHSRDLRKGRYSRPGNCYFLTTCVEGRRPIFERAARAKIILDSVRWVNDRKLFAVDAAVVMPDHLHLVGQLRDGTLAALMRVLKGFTANQLSAAGVETPVWQAGYHDHGLRHNEDYRTRVRYVLQNPVRAGLVERVDDYPFLILPEWWVSPLDHL